MFFKIPDKFIIETPLAAIILTGLSIRIMMASGISPRCQTAWNEMSRRTGENARLAYSKGEEDVNEVI